MASGLHLLKLSFLLHTALSAKHGITICCHAYIEAVCLSVMLRYHGQNGYFVSSYVVDLPRVFAIWSCKIGNLVQKERPVILHGIAVGWLFSAENLKYI